MKKIDTKKIFLVPIFAFLLIADIYKPLLLKGKENSERIAIDLNYLDNYEEGDYILGQGDSLKIEISEELPSLTKVHNVSVAGTINLPLIFRTYISGLSIDELTKLLNEKYKQYLKYPNLKIEIVKYRSVNIFVDGEVAEPGPYLLSGSNNSFLEGGSNLNEISSGQEMINPITNVINSDGNINTGDVIFSSFPTVYTALKAAKGITLNADLSKITITRLNPISENGGRKKVTLNLLGYILNGNSAQNIRLRDGDTIYVNKGKELTVEQISKAIKLNINPRFVNTAF